MAKKIGNDKEGNIRFEPYLSALANRLVRNPIRKVNMKMLEHPGCLSLAGGRPPKDVFPELVRKWGDESLMNYGPALAHGGGELKKWAREMVRKFHAPPSMEDRDILITSGNTDGITKTVMLVSEPGDVVLADEVTYPGIQASAVPLGRRVVGVPLDHDGIIPERLESVLQGLECGVKARILYLTPHGQNPTGATLSESRKDAIYTIARKYDLVILEDDPYIFVNLMPNNPGDSLAVENMKGARSTPKSFLARDTDCRVVRLDSVSKFVAPGYRLGWVTGHKHILAKWCVVGEVFTWSVSGAMQKSFLDIIEGWGDEGLHAHLQRLQYTYAKRRGYLLAACEKHLTGLCRWQTPEFGMFFWLEVLGCVDTELLIDELIESYGVALVPGKAFATPEGADEHVNSFFRVSFSLLEEETADKAILQLKAFLLARAGASSGSEASKDGMQ